MIETRVANVKVVRKWISSQTTIGEIYVNDKFFSFTLEDTVRATGIKVDAETAIPEGSYKVSLSVSSRFKRLMPMIYTEDNGYEIIRGGISFKGVRIHGGNTHKNTEGCILVAYNKVNSTTIQGSSEKDLVKLLQNYDSINLVVENKQELI